MSSFVWQNFSLEFIPAFNPAPEPMLAMDQEPEPIPAKETLEEDMFIPEPETTAMLDLEPKPAIMLVPEQVLIDLSGQDLIPNPEPTPQGIPSLPAVSTGLLESLIPSAFLALPPLLVSWILHFCPTPWLCPLHWLYLVLWSRPLLWLHLAYLLYPLH